MNTHEVIIGRVVTEKATRMEKINVYAFYVAQASSKDQIKTAMKAMYGAVAEKVTTVSRAVRPRRAGKYRREMQDSPIKIAYVTLDKPLGKIITQ